NVLSVVILKTHPSSRGAVHLTKNHPQDPLRIHKRHFEPPGGREDVISIRDAIKVALSTVEHLDLAVHVDARVIPGPEMKTDADIEDYISRTVYGHHACCTTPTGGDDETNAVLDGDFKIREVENLRVVDISSWPRVPG
ncbi:glucose-methanol-choline oxidoreductase, partial [Mycena latifolia]